MRRRLYFLLPDIDTTHIVVNELLLARIDAGHIHVIAHEDTDIEDLPEASLLQSSDVVHGVELGLSLGGATGVLAGLAALASAPANYALGGGTLLLCAVAGALIGAWGAGMIGTDIPNTRLKEFRTAISGGQLLVMVDTPKNRVEEISRAIRQHHPEADMHGVEPTIPAFP